MVRSKRPFIGFIIVSAIVALIATMGNVSFTFFAFPVNVALLFSLMGITYIAYQEKAESNVMQMMRATTTSVALIALLFLFSIVIAFCPQWNFQRSWAFTFVLILLLINLQLTIMSYHGRHRRRFYLTHIGLYMFLVSLSFGAPDTHRSRTIVRQGQTVEQALNFNGDICPIGFPLTLQLFEVSYYENHVPRSFNATIEADGELHEIKVNHPWHRSWKEDVYLVSHGVDETTQQPYCVLEFITQPWKYIVHLSLIMTAIGAFLLLWGKKNKQ